MSLPYSSLRLTNISTPVVQPISDLLDPYATSTPGLAANQICRIILALVGNLLCWVPFRLLARNGEFVAVIFIGDVMVINLFTIFNASIWPNDDWNSWWDGTGYCDVQTYLLLPMQCLYAACIFAIMRNLAQRLRLRRVNNLSQPERRRQHLMEALIIFPVPIIQLALTWFLLTNRYVIGTITGCYGMFDQSWFKIFVLIFPPAMFSIGTIPYAYLTWKRFRDISKTTKVALAANTEASSRAQRTRRRLYQMAISIITPYVPLQMAFFVINLKETLTLLTPYDYYAIHFIPYPYPWKAIIFLPSWDMDFATLNQPWVAIVTTIPIVMFFGMTQDAIDAYRGFLVQLGFGFCFPKLKDPYKPKPRSNETSKRSWWSSSKSIKPTDKETFSSQASTVHPNSLPNQHHQTIITSDGPFIPPRASSSSLRGPGPAIPPRHSSLRRGFLLRNAPLKHIPLPVKMPSLSTLRSGRKTRNKGESSSSTFSGNEACEQTIPLRSMEAEEPPRKPAPGSSLAAPSSEGRAATPRDLLSSGANSSRTESEWTLRGSSWSRLAPPQHHTERSRPVAESESFEDTGNGFVRIKITGAHNKFG